MGERMNRALAVGGWALAVFALAAAGVMYHRVRTFDRAHDCDVLAGQAPAAVRLQEQAAVCKAAAVGPKEPSDRQEQTPAADSVTTNAPEKTVLKVVRVDYDGDRELSVVLNARPDMDAVDRYVRLDSVPDGGVSVRYDTDYDFRKRIRVPTLCVTGDFAYRTNLTLTILKGFPPDGKGTDSEGALEADYSFTFRRRDPDPAVAFADDGRYLPPGGRKAVRVEAISVTNVATSLCRVEPRNIVQLLAREEGVYRRGRWQRTVDEEDTEELSGACETGLVRCVNRPCEKEAFALPVAMRDGGPSNGVFLVTVRNADRPRMEYSWDDTPRNPNVYRLVCLSDLGLSVRQGKDGLGVWVTSLMTGRPVAGAHVEVYSSANTPLGSGTADANGWCAVTCGGKGEPFAVVAYTESGDDMTFLALRESMKVDETHEDGERPPYLAASELDACVWTERGIYRHDERIFVHALVRNGARRAPEPLPLVLRLTSPKGREFASKTVLTDADGALVCDAFAVPGEQPSGKWKIAVCLPGKGGRLLAERTVKVEEFAPPQIRVAVRADAGRHPTNFTFAISAEHLFGGPASALACEGAVVFEDVPFVHPQWKGYAFGNDDRGLKPCFRRLSRQVLDADGSCRCEAPLLADAGLPKAAVRATGQGVVFEDGGRPATARKSVVCHYYPFYVGATLTEWMRRPAIGLPKVDLVCVDPEGRSVTTCRTLLGRVERIDSVYSYRRNCDGTSTWDCERFRKTLFDKVEIPVDASGRATYALPLAACGDYVFTAEDPATGASFARTFYLSDWGDDVVRAPLADPTAVSVRTDKPLYRVGERPRLVVKSPFAGYALMSVLREGEIYSEILNLTNVTSEVVLRPVGRDWAPNVDVSISVVQSVAASAKRLAARARGMATVRVRPQEDEIDVKLAAEVEMKKADHGDDGGGSRVTVDVSAPGATAAVVTLVDEGINLLTGEETPDPVAWFSRVRTAGHPLYDLFSRILPVADDALRVGGVKTGGGYGAEMLGRVSPVASRRFKPLALWREKVALAAGRGRTVFELPEFVGEVRVTAVAYSAGASGAASVQKKVTPKLVMQPDAPRFVAPGDVFEVTLPLRMGECDGEREGEGRRVKAKEKVKGEGCVEYSIGVDGMGSVLSGRVTLAKGGSTNVVARLTAPKTPGELAVRYRAEGLGETHAVTIPVPVRPAVAWREETEVVRLEPGQVLGRENAGGCPRFSVTVGASPMAELAAALEWLSDYPHGCLEQTCSRIFPLVAAGGILNSVASKQSANREEYVAAGVRRVESMVRENDFVMWPDCTCAPWDREVSLYAAHFLVEAEKAGQKLNPAAKERVLGFLRGWALGTNDCVSAYACHTLALADVPEKDRMFRLYDRRTDLDALSRARLARAFAAIRDMRRAEALMALALEPQSVREAAFRVLALSDFAPDDARLPGLVQYLTAQRDRGRFAWGTTSENACALLALGAYYRHHPAKDGEVRVGNLGKRDVLKVAADRLCLTNTGPATAFLTIRRQWLGDPKDEADEANGIFVSRRYLQADGTPADLGRLVRGELLVAELTVTSDVTRVVGDLVIEDLFAAAFEPVHRELDPGGLPSATNEVRAADWILRKDARDDRMLVFSRRFELKKGYEAKVFYPVRVVSAGDFVLPGPAVEGMYHPELRARRAPRRLVVRP